MIVKNGDEFPIAAAVKYLNGLGIPSRDMRSVTIDGEVGSPVMITVSLYVDTEAPGVPDKSHYGASECGPACARLAPGTEHTHGDHEGVFVTPRNADSGVPGERFVATRTETLSMPHKNDYGIAGSMIRAEEDHRTRGEASDE
jgi:hypothetical protein